MAQRLASASPFRVTHPVQANAVFVEMDEPRRIALYEAGWQAYRFLDGSVRFMCSWATTPEAVDSLAQALDSIR
jgi:threonine aldolase